jgi:hypothetical protein
MFAAVQTKGCKGRGPGQMKRGRFGMSPLGTDVTGVGVPEKGAVVRCTGISGASLSLSLSLPARDFLALKTAPTLIF